MSLRQLYRTCFKTANNPDNIQTPGKWTLLLTTQSKNCKTFEYGSILSEQNRKQYKNTNCVIVPNPPLLLRILFTSGNYILPWMTLASFLWHLNYLPSFRHFICTAKDLWRVLNQQSALSWVSMVCRSIPKLSFPLKPHALVYRERKFSWEQEMCLSMKEQRAVSLLKFKSLWQNEGIYFVVCFHLDVSLI